MNAGRAIRDKLLGRSSGGSPVKSTTSAPKPSKVSMVPESIQRTENVADNAFESCEHTENETHEGNIHDSADFLQSIAESLITRVSNWHGLDTSRFGKLQLYGTLTVSKDQKIWQTLDCFLFSHMLICVKERPEEKSYTLKGSILIRKHLQQVSLPNSGGNVLIISLSVSELPIFCLKFTKAAQLDSWRQALLEIIEPAQGGDRNIPRSSLQSTDECQPEPTFTRILKVKRGLWGFINGTKTAAFADTGAGQNAVSAAFAAGMKLGITPAIRFFRLGNNKPVRSPGTVQFSWSFAEDPDKIYQLVCHVLPTCIYEVIIGRAFLIATETLSIFRHRLTECSFPGFSFLNLGLLGETHQRIRLEGVLDDHHTVLALPDTGAECNVIEKRFAVLYDLPIDYTCTNWVQFADCTYQQTLGRVNTHWTFASGERIPITFEVLENCADKVIIGEDIIYNHDVFNEYCYSIRTFNQEPELHLPELAPFAFISSSQKKANDLAKKLLGGSTKGEATLSAEDQALDAERLRREDWNIQTDFGNNADAVEKKAEKERRAEFNRLHPPQAATLNQGPAVSLSSNSAT